MAKPRRRGTAAHPTQVFELPRFAIPVDTPIDVPGFEVFQASLGRVPRAFKKFRNGSRVNLGAGAVPKKGVLKKGVLKKDVPRMRGGGMAKKRKK